MSVLTLLMGAVQKQFMLHSTTISYIIRINNACLSCPIYYLLSWIIGKCWRTLKREIMSDTLIAALIEQN